MSKTEKNSINGFEFENQAEGAQAEKEVEGIAYIREKIDMDNPEAVLQIYQKMIQQNLFETAVGFSYLKELQEYLRTIPFIRNEDIPPIKIQHPILTQDVCRGAGLLEKEKKAKKTEKKPMHIDYKRRFEVTAFFGLILAVCVAAMFIITSTSGSPTIINYENALINKYEAWEQELDEREAAIEEREQILGLPQE